jgi:hypothetical protein
VNAVAPTFESIAAPLDHARSRLMRVVLATKVGAFVIARRDRRVAAQAAISVLVTFALVAFAPVFVLAVAPIVFGVPHVASDVRYLVLRRGVTREAIVTTIIFAALVTVTRAFDAGAVEMGLLCAWIAAAGVLGARASGKSDRAGITIVVACALAAIAIPHAQATRLVLAHAHNVIAIVVWLVLFRRAAKTAILPLALAGVAVIVLASGALPIGAHGAAFGQTMGDATKWLAPGLSGRAAVGLVLSFAFLQSMHYGVWLGWIPQEDVASEGTLSFRMSIRSIVRDFGPRGLAVVVVLSALVLAGAFVSMTRTRELYLSLATFHGYLEIAMLAYFMNSARRAA